MDICIRWKIAVRLSPCHFLYYLSAEIFFVETAIRCTLRLETNECYTVSFIDPCSFPNTVSLSSFFTCFLRNFLASILAENFRKLWYVKQLPYINSRNPFLTFIYLEVVAQVMGKLQLLKTVLNITVIGSFFYAHTDGGTRQYCGCKTTIFPDNHLHNLFFFFAERIFPLYNIRNCKKSFLFI